jgi:hypothetical protein
VVQLLPPITIAARQELALYSQKQKEGDTTAAEQHRVNYQQRALAQVQFFCKLAGQQALTKHAAALFKVRCMPADVTKLIQEAGLQLTTAHLVAAASGRVEGLESWVATIQLKKVGPWQWEQHPLDLLVRSIYDGEVVSGVQVWLCFVTLQCAAAVILPRGMALAAH